MRAWAQGGGKDGRTSEIAEGGLSLLGDPAPPCSLLVQGPQRKTPSPWGLKQVWGREGQLQQRVWTSRAFRKPPPPRLPLLALGRQGWIGVKETWRSSVWRSA